MQFALLIYESAQGFAARKNDGNDPYIGAWRAYYKALVESSNGAVEVRPLSPELKRRVTE